MSELNKNFGEDNEDHLTKQSDYPEWWRHLVKERKEEGLKAGEFMAVEPLILKRFMDHIGKRVKKDVATKNIVFLTALSAYTGNPINLFLRGESSIGKTYNTVETLKYFPKEDTWMLGGLSPTAIVHSHGVLVDANGEEIDFRQKPKKDASEEEKERWRKKLAFARYIVDLSHKIIVFLEAPQKRTYLMLRPILSHDKEEISYRFTDKTGKGRLQAFHVVVKGWPATIFLSTREDYIKDLATRSFTATPETTSEKFRAAIRLTSEMKAYPWKFKEDKEFMLLQAFIQWFKCNVGDFRVALPFARELGEFWPAVIPRAMRDYEHFTALIEIVTLFHCYQRPILNVGNTKIVLATMKDFQYVLNTFSYLEETTLTGLGKHILDCFHEVMEPIFGEQGAFSTEDLTQKYNAVFTEKKSSKTLRRYVGLLEEIGWVNTEPHPSDKRKNLITIIKNSENMPFSGLRIFPESFTLEKLEKWVKQIGTHNPILLRENVLAAEDTNIPLSSLYKNHYFVPISSEQGTPSKSETTPKDMCLTEKGVILSATVQEAVEYALGMMAKRLPNKSTGDIFIHDLQFKGLSEKEAKKLLDNLTDEGPLGYDNEGWLVKR